VIDDTRLSGALELLSSTDEEAAELKVNAMRKEYLVDLKRKQMFLSSEGNIETRKALAESSREVQDSITVYLDATVEFEKLKAKRTTEALIVEVWRTQSANQRQGNV
jgi:transcription elongation GreA/GreB family factor